MSQRIDVAVLGATGTVGERLIAMLGAHPWFRLAEVGASEQSAGHSLAERLEASGRAAPPAPGADLRLRPAEGPWRSPLLLSALPSSVAGPLERALVDAGHVVVSNASSHRMDEDVPLVVPEVNADHLGLLDARKETGRKEAGRSGALVTNPNCVVAGVALALAPLHRELGLEAVVLTTFQAISGAGRPGPSAADLVDNVVPHVAGEEEKIGPELRKILGTLGQGSGPGQRRVEPAGVRVSATATRVPVLHGHLASLSMAFRDDVGPEDVVEVLRSWRSPVTDDALPTAPGQALRVLDGVDRPQPRLDRDLGAGMTVSVGRIRPCEVHHVRMMVLSHNLVRGAAGAALLNAELCRARGWLDDPAPGRGDAGVGRPATPAEAR